ncbi:hypothetical protein A9Q88_11810 [Gammaproteobacteria bacterium 50_400_T64]|nr:hypothetical protein A9Q88_11810 [Gammaproteobacteria bacterium 50_400_T64]
MAIDPSDIFGFGASSGQSRNSLIVVEPGIHPGIFPVGSSLGFGKKEDNFITLPRFININALT